MINDPERSSYDDLALDNALIYVNNGLLEQIKANNPPENLEKTLSDITNLNLSPAGIDRARKAIGALRDAAFANDNYELAARITPFWNTYNQALATVETGGPLTESNTAQLEDEDVIDRGLTDQTDDKEEWPDYDSMEFKDFDEDILFKLRKFSTEVDEIVQQLRENKGDREALILRLGKILSSLDYIDTILKKRLRLVEDLEEEKRLEARQRNIQRIKNDIPDAVEQKAKLNAWKESIDADPAIKAIKDIEIKPFPDLDPADPETSIRMCIQYFDEQQELISAAEVVVDNYFTTPGIADEQKQYLKETYIDPVIETHIRARIPEVIKFWSAKLAAIIVHTFNDVGVTIPAEPESEPLPADLQATIDIINAQTLVVEGFLPNDVDHPLYSQMKEILDSSELFGAVDAWKSRLELNLLAKSPEFVGLIDLTEISDLMEESRAIHLKDIYPYPRHDLKLKSEETSISKAGVLELRSKLARILVSVKNGQSPELPAPIAKLVAILQREIDHLDGALKLLNTELDPDEMTLDELKYEILDKNIDIFRWSEFKGGQVTDRRGRVRAKFVEKIGGFNNSARENQQDINNIVALTEVQMSFLVSELSYESGKASVDISKLSGEINRTQLDKTRLIVATTFHPVWGRAIREMLSEVILTAAGADGRNNSKFNYGLLASAEGSDALAAFLADSRFDDDTLYDDGGLSDYEKKQAREMARKFAALLFKGFDMLTIILAADQRMTQTRSHNGSVKETSRILLSYPLSEVVHRSFRYPGNPVDYTAWWLIYSERPDEASFRTAGGKDRTLTYGEMIQTRNLAIAHQEMLFPTSGFEGKIPIQKAGEPLFPDTHSLVTLRPGSEALRIGNEIINGGGEIIRFGLEDGTERHRVFLEISGKWIEIAEVKSDELFLMDTGRGGMWDGKNLGKVGKAKLKRPGDRKVEEKEKVAFDSYFRSLGIDPAIFNQGVIFVENHLDFDTYDIAISGWEKLMKFAFEGVPGGLSFEQIVEKPDDAGKKKGGLLSQWTSAAGQAKMATGEHLNVAIEPMLIHFIHRLFHSYKEREVESRERLLHAIIDILIESIEEGGVSNYKDEIIKVINYLLEGNGASYDQLKADLLRRKQAEARGSFIESSIDLRLPDKFLYLTPAKRLEQRRKYLEAWWRRRYGTHPPSQKSRAKFPKSQEEREYWEMMGNLLTGVQEKPIETPLPRDGSVIQVDDKKES